MLNCFDHEWCQALSILFRGDLCATLTDRPGRLIDRGTYLYTAGDRGQSVYVVRRGLIKVSLLSADGKEQTLRVYKPGEIFGELCFCTGFRNEQAYAMEPSEVVELTFEELLGHLQEHRHALRSFLSTISHHLADAYDQIRLLSFEKVMARLVETLLRLADEMGERTGEGIRLKYPLTQDDLAQMIGARREVTSPQSAPHRRMHPL